MTPNSRSYLNRWLQPDSIIPDPYNPLDYDRYSYVRNNPVNFNDPSGHCPFCIIVGGIAIGAYYYGVGFGLTADLVGIAHAEAAMGGKGGSIEVAAGLAVQGEFAGVLDNLIGKFSDSPGYGLAQVGQSELDYLGLGTSNPNDPAVAVKVMQARTDMALGACQTCKGNKHDRLIVTALAQNGQFKNKGALDELRDLTNQGEPDWASFINTHTSGGSPDAIFRAGSGTNYAYLMLIKYSSDLEELYQRGWKLPDGITEDDLIWLRDWASDQINSNDSQR